MTNDQAKKIIQCLGWGYSDGEIKEAVGIASDAMDKGTALKPGNIHGVEGGPAILIIGYCPFCRHEVTPLNNFCYICGQALDWSVEEDNGI